MSSDRRQRKKEHRAQRLEAERKTAARRELIRRLTTGLGFGLVIAVALILASRGGSSQLPDTYREFRDRPVACGATAPDPYEPMTFDAPEPGQIPAGAAVTVTLRTSCGPITIELDPARYPETANNFVFLARRGFYDATVIHRVVQDFVIQGGDPRADGTGGPGYTIEDEFPPEGFTFEPGVVAMANAGPGTTGSQFFIVVGSQADILPPRFNILGRVVDGFDTIEKILAVPTARQPGTVEESRPLEAIYIEAVDVDISS